MYSAGKIVLVAALFFGLYFLSSSLDAPVAHRLVVLCGEHCGHRTSGQVPPALLIALCVVRTVLIVLITSVIAILDRRHWTAYGLRPFPLRQLVGGLIAGTLGISAVIAALALNGNVAFTGFNETGAAALSYGAVWAVGMLLVGLSEEMAFRGAPVFLLSRISPALAILVSAALFIAVHAGNEDENLNGLIQIGLFGAVAAASVVRTGSLAWAIGFHAAWDWTLEYLSGAVGSGYVFEGHLLNQTVLGPEWLTGGSSGLEGSLFSYLVLVVIGILVALRKMPGMPRVNR
jgi:membrane protease YdiL (CAAX protease family)